MRIDRIWAMPNKWTFTIKPIAEMLSEEVSGVFVDPFCGLHSPAQIRNDLNPDVECDLHLDALSFLKTLPGENYDGVLFDPPYSITQAKQCYDAFGKEKLEINVSNVNYPSLKGQA